MSASWFRVLDAADVAERREWLELWHDWPTREVQAHPAYVALFTGSEERALAATLRSEAGSVLFPFVLRQVPSSKAATGRSCTDVVTPYGYGGAYTWSVSDPNTLARRFWDAFTQWAGDAAVVSEFVRLSLFEDALLPYPGSVTVKQDNVVVDLALPEDELWMSFDHKVRKNVNKARRSGVEVEVDTTGAGYDVFSRIYKATMERRGADQGYYFGREFFDAIHRELAGQFAYFHARVDDVAVSTELVLLSQRSAYSFLGGTLDDAYGLRPNDLLKFEIMRWSARNGRIRFVLGGGFEPGDGIFRYKRAFAPRGVRPFKVGTRILDNASYGLLAGKRSADRTMPARDGFFPAYRS
ncbi:hypothetical protein GCM10028798_14100 [Humibacter antri]